MCLQACVAVYSTTLEGMVTSVQYMSVSNPPKKHFHLFSYLICYSLTVSLQLTKDSKCEFEEEKRKKKSLTLEAGQKQASVLVGGEVHITKPWLCKNKSAVLAT